MEIKVNKSQFPKNNICTICNKFYASQSSLCHHNTKFHKNESNDNSKDKSKESKDFKLSCRFSCRYCKKNYKHKQTRWTHEQNCKNKNNTTDNNILLKNEINELKDKINILLKSNKIHPKTIQKINNIQNNNIQNNNIQNNNINVTYVKFGNENLSEILSKKEMKKILSYLRFSIEESIKMVHFNDDRPQYKNIFITNMHDNLAYIFNGKKFEVKSKDYVLSDLLNNHLDNIESFIEDNKIDETIKNRHLFKFIREINGDEINKDLPNYKNYKLNNIKQLIYNNCDKNLLKNLNKLNLNEYNNTDQLVS